MELTSLKNEAMKLAPAGRVQLAKELLNSLEQLSKPEMEQLWVEEATRRNTEIENGTVELRTAEDVMKEARALLK
jgi:hypothetical protein